VISAPGGDRPSWAFDTLDHHQSAAVGLGGVAASTLVVNEVAGAQSIPPCPHVVRYAASRCRALHAEGNQGSR